ncbi:RNA-binding protein Cwf29 [Entomophthora muscae]|uniref:RNA-binding protein Cwf29 n=1 Tax=Entomophthora muscae TaxID=34485 RepID=A0ACC2TRT5_9FUNG|nr:RNA-binding protein Cwf29 [Entomophthora muscae]
MNVVKEIERINAKEIDLIISRGLEAGGSWHDEHKDSAYVYIGGLPYEASEGDVITIFSQYGEVLDINMIRDEKTGKSKGFAFLGYQDQRSTVLAVDNFNGIKLADRTLRVDHVKNYKPPSRKDADGNKIVDLRFNAAPQPIEYDSPDEKEQAEPEMTDEAIMVAYKIDQEDPMAPYLLEKAKKAIKKEKKRKEKKSKKDKKSKSKKDYKKREDSPPIFKEEKREPRHASRTPSRSPQHGSRPIHSKPHRSTSPNIRSVSRGRSPLRLERKRSPSPRGSRYHSRRSRSRSTSRSRRDDHSSRKSYRSRSPRQESRR